MRGKGTSDHKVITFEVSYRKGKHADTTKKLLHFDVTFLAKKCQLGLHIRKQRHRGEVGIFYGFIK